LFDEQINDDDDDNISVAGSTTDVAVADASATARCTAVLRSTFYVVAVNNKQQIINERARRELMRSE